MTPEQFVYWLQGYLEISNTKTIDEAQVTIIKDHIKTVFNKVTPSYTYSGIATTTPTITPTEQSDMSKKFASAAEAWSKSTGHSPALYC